MVGLSLITSLQQGILAEDSISSAERRAAAESLGVLARLGGDSYASRLVCFLILVKMMWEIHFNNLASHCISSYFMFVMNFLS